jgi:hypothetical protein
MKTNKLIAFLSFILVVSLSGCSPEDDITIPNFTPLLFAEDFAAGAVDNTTLNTTGWKNYAETGTALWKEQVYSGNAYAEFSSYLSGNAVNVAWLISPKINMDANDHETLVFQASQSYVSSSSNSLQVFVSNNFDGTNVTGATWTPIAATLPTTASPYFEFIKSGEIDLSQYTGNISIAFKVTGSGTNTTLDGSYQIDDIRVFNK